MTKAQVGQSQGQATTVRVEDVEIRPGWMETTMNWNLGTPFPLTTNLPLPLRRTHARAPIPEPHLLGPSRSQTSPSQKIRKTTTTIFVTDLIAEANTGTDGTVLTKRTLEEDAARAIWIHHQRPSGMYCHLSLVAPLAHHTGPGRLRSDTTKQKSRL